MKINTKFVYVMVKMSVEVPDGSSVLEVVKQLDPDFKVPDELIQNIDDFEIVKCHWRNSNGKLEGRHSFSTH